MDKRKPYGVMIGCLAVGGFLFVGMAISCGVIGYSISTGRLASIEALPQGKIPANQLAEISRIVSVRPNEKILYFYSAGITVSSDGNLFTNERVISYTTDYGPLEIFGAEYGDIQTATLHRSESWLDDSTLDLLLNDGTTLTLWVSSEKDRDQDFYDKLIDQLEQHRAAQKKVTMPETGGSRDTE